MSTKLEELLRITKLLPPAKLEEAMAQIKGMLESKGRDVNQCPFCDTKKNFVSYGTKNKKQRYKCKACLRIFTERTGTELSYSHSSDSEWLAVIRDTLTGVSSYQSEANLGIERNRVLRMRQAIMRMIETHLEESGGKLDRIVEVDDTYFLLNVKGTHIQDPKAYGRLPRYHGLKAKSLVKPLLSDAQTVLIEAVVERREKKFEHLSSVLKDFPMSNETGKLRCETKDEPLTIEAGLAYFKDELLNLVESYMADDISIQELNALKRASNVIVGFSRKSEIENIIKYIEMSKLLNYMAMPDIEVFKKWIHR